MIVTLKKTANFDAKTANIKKESNWEGLLTVWWKKLRIIICFIFNYVDCFNKNLIKNT